MTSKGQVTLPKQVREKLGLATGDELMFSLEGNAVRIQKARPIDVAWHRSLEEMLAPEWNSPEDDEAFGDLQSL
jgi:AbrB family looped-hinge helix DNA binding protein